MSKQVKSPREFRNALYKYLTENNVTADTATQLASEAELYVLAYNAYQLRSIEFAADILVALFKHSCYNEDTTKGDRTWK